MTKQKTIVITGATSGIGLAGMILLAQQGHHIIGIGRKEERCYNAIKQVRKQCNNASVKFFVADLSSQTQVRRVCVDITEYLNENHSGTLDVLINNAGMFTSYYTLSEDGIEMQFAVNHLAPFIMTNLLVPLLQQSENARVLTTSSNSHYGGKLNFTDVMFSSSYGQLKAYKQSKLANVLFTYELNRRLSQASNITAYAIDPALVNTPMGDKHTAGLSKWIWKKRRKSGVSPREGASTMVYLASEDIDDNINCFYYKYCKPKTPSKRARSISDAKLLWEMSENFCGHKGA